MFLLEWWQMQCSLHVAMHKWFQLRQPHFEHDATNQQILCCVIRWVPMHTLENLQKSKHQIAAERDLADQ